MIIPDTSIWIEFLKNNQDYYPTLKALLEDRRILAVECIFGELLQGAKNPREISIISLYWQNLPKALIDDGWIEAGIYPSTGKLMSKGVGLIDSYIIITAGKYDARIWSLDKKLNSLLKPDERYGY